MIESESLSASETQLTGRGLLFRSARDIAILAVVIFVPLYLFNLIVITEYWITWGVFIWFRICLHGDIQFHRTNSDSPRVESAESDRRLNPLVSVAIAYLLYVVCCFIGVEFFWVRANENLLILSKHSSALDHKLIIGAILLCNWVFLNIELLSVLKANRSHVGPEAKVARTMVLLVHLGIMPALMSFLNLGISFDDGQSTSAITRWVLVGTTGLYLLILCLMFVPKGESASDS